MFVLRLSVAVLSVALLSAQDGAGDYGRRPLELQRGVRKVRQIKDQRVLLEGACRLVLTAATEPVGAGARIDIESFDAYVQVAKLSPAEVRSQLFGQPTVQWFVLGERAVLDDNLRLVPVEDGTLLVAEGHERAPLVAYREKRMRGKPRLFGCYDYFKKAELGDDDDAIASFVLQPWSMVTMAEHEDGNGVSRVFVAEEEPLELKELPKELRDKVSFVRVFPWFPPTKKGFAGGAGGARQLRATWRYDWMANGQSEPGLEYVPMQKYGFSGSLDGINRMRGVTHLLGFNEPMQKDQANLPMERCLELWPKLQESGLRLGSPSPTDGTLGWLYEFCDKADARGLRVDFVAVHYYKGGWSTKQTMAWLEGIHRRTGRPLWVTEFNNGAGWVQGHDPSLEENAEVVEAMCRAMDEAPFIERYAIFDLGNPRHRRQVWRDGGLTPMGARYRDNPSVPLRIAVR